MNRGQSLLIFAIFCLITPSFARADQVGHIYEMGKTQGDPVAVQKMHEETSTDGITSSEATITDPEGKVLLSESASRKGSELISQTTNQLQDHKRFSATVKDGEVTFQEESIQNPDKPERVVEKKQKIEGVFLVGPTAEPYIREHWADLSSGQKLKVRFGVVELSDIYGFEFFKVGDSEWKGRKSTEFKMKPTSFFISMLSDPILLTFDNETKSLVRYRGRIPLKHMKDGKLKAFDAEVLYDLDLPTPSPSPTPSGSPNPSPTPHS